METNPRRFTIIFPYCLVWFRLALAPAFFIAWALGANPWVYIAMLVAGIISDIYDGVLARRWNTSTPLLRRLDGNVDTLFWGCAGGVAVLLHADWLRPWWLAFLIMFLFLFAQNLVPAFRYGRQPSYHMWSAKIWSLSIVILLIGLFLGHPSAWVLNLSFALGYYNSIEGIIATLILPKPLTDIPTVFHAIKLAHPDHQKPTRFYGML